MAKARGNKLVPPTNYSRNPMLTTPNTPLVSNSMMPYRGPSAVDVAGDRAAAAQIQNSASQINSLVARSQAANPMVPRSPGFGIVDPAAESARRLAPMLAQDAARQQNTPMNGMTAYEADPTRYRPGDPAIQARQLDNAQRVTSGRLMDRTRSNPMADQVNSQANAVASGRGWYLGGQFVGATGNPQWGIAENMRRRVELNNAPQQATQEQRDSARARRAGAQRQFMDENNGMNYLQARRAERQAGLKERSFKKAVTRGLNPMSPEAQALFPQQVAKMKGQSVAQENPLVGGGRTLEAQQAAATRIQERETVSPMIAGLGVEPGSGLSGLNRAIQNRIAEDPNTEFSDAALKEYQAHAKDYSGISTDQNSFFAFGNSEVDKQQSDMWRELAELPDNPRSRSEWLQRYKDKTSEAKTRMAESMKEAPPAPVVSGNQAPIAGNPFGYAAPYSNTFNRGVKPLSMYSNPMR